MSALANVVDMVARIADCCDDGALRRLVEGTPAYAELVDEEVSYQGKDGRKRWNELGDTIADSWERAIRPRRSTGWTGRATSRESEFDDEDTLWDRIGAEPIGIRIGDTTYLTVRADIPVDAEGDELETAFLGEAGESVAVFTEVADLARYCREAKGHRLVKLEWWSELADVEDDAFQPHEDAVHDLRKPSTDGAELLRELAQFCTLDADTDVLDGPSIDREDWRTLVDEVRSCFDVAD